MNTCIFCKILTGEAPASFVYRDEQVAAFLDIQPVNPGHLLIVPVRHARYLADLDEEDGAQMFRIAQKLSNALYLADIRCEANNLFLANGASAGQDVFHIHLHVLPRYRGDGFGFRFGPNYGYKPSRAELDAIAVQIRSAVRG